tara:strand:+ start:180 stop:656 length:477 start_codon:yes stop_codon:yes gene_type:complete
MSEIDLWEKYHYESKQTICVIGVLILTTKLCQADGHFSEREESEILSIIPHESAHRHTLKKIINEASNDKNPIEYHALNLKKLLRDEQPDFLEFIVAVLYRLAHSDNLYSQSEDDDIREVSKIFGIKRDLSDNCKDLFSNFFLKFTNLLKKKTENINA